MYERATRRAAPDGGWLQPRLEGHAAPCPPPPDIVLPSTESRSRAPTICAGG